MKAGRELDARIAEEVMGSQRPTIEHDVVHPFEAITSDDGCWYCLCEYDKGDVCRWYPKPFSTQIADAMPVFDKIVEKEGIAVITRYAPEGRTHYWEIEWGYRGKKVRVDTLPHAICLAALAVVERRE